MVERPSAPTVTTASVPGPRQALVTAPPGLVLIPMLSAEQHVLVVIGEADVRTAPQLRATLLRLIAAQPPLLLVELAALEFCDLHGLDALEDATRAAAADRVPLTLHGMTHTLNWLFATCSRANRLDCLPGRRPVPGATP